MITTDTTEIKSTTQEEFVPISIAARELFTSTQTIRKLVREGRVPFRRFGPKSTRVSIDHLRAMRVPTK